MKGSEPQRPSRTVLNRSEREGVRAQRASGPEASKQNEKNTSRLIRRTGTEPENRGQELNVSHMFGHKVRRACAQDG